MMEFFNQMEPLLKGFWFVALPVSLLFIIQTVMTFMGADASDGVDADFDGNLDGTDAPFQLFSLRNLINFLLGFSWTGISFYQLIASPGLLIGLSVLVGVLFVLLFFFIIRQLQRLAEDNTFQLKNTVNQTAEVYLTIPANKQGIGKIMISVRGSVHELNAVTNGEALPSGSLVRVIQLENDNLLLVEKL